MEGMRLLVVNADELGRSAGINQGIAEAHDRGIVTSASLMVRRDAAAAAAELARQRPELSVGLHVDLGEWVCRGGEWTQLEAVVPLGDALAVQGEVLRQLEAFRELFGRNPTHLDSHQNVHRSGPALACLLALSADLAVPLRHSSKGVFVCADFHAQTSQGLPFPEGVSVGRLLALLDALPPGITELVCHPGLATGGGGTYEAEREWELEVLCEPRVRRGLEERGIRLCSFEGMGAVASSAAGPRQMEHSFRGRGREAYERGDFDEALAWFERAVVVGEDLPWPWLWLARAQLRTGDAKGSRSSIRRALALVPGWPPGLLHLADLHLEAGGSAEAAEILGALARKNGEDGAAAASGVAQRIRRLEDPAIALRVAEALAASQPGEAPALAARWVALRRAGDEGEARLCVARALRSGEAPALRAAAEFHLEAGRPAAAWKALRGGEPEPGDAPLLGRVAQALRRAGDLTRAWEAFDSALAVRANDGAARYWRDVVVGEVQVLSGVATPVLAPLEHYRPVTGRVLHVVGRSLPHIQTGYSVRTRYVTIAQRLAGLDPHVVTQLGFPWGDGVEEAALWEEVAGIAHHRLATAGGVPARLDDRLELNARGLEDLARRVRPAALHAASDYRNALLALALGRACGIPVVYEVRGFWEDTWSSKQAAEGSDASLAYRWRRERELECMRGADAVVTLAGVMKDELVLRGIPAAKIAVVPNAVDSEAFRPVARDEGLARGLGLAPNEVVAGYVSSFVSYEGIRFLVEALARLAARGLPVRGLLVGDGEERERLESLTREVGMEGRILFTGRVPHEKVAEYYRLIDVFVVPRTADRVCQLVTPLKPYEAMAMERAVVVSGVRALREMVVPGETGMVFRPEDPDDLADVLEPLVRSLERRRALGRAAREWVCRHRTWAQNAERYAELYRTLGVLPAPEPGRPRSARSLRSPGTPAAASGTLPASRPTPVSANAPRGYAPGDGKRVRP